MKIISVTDFDVTIQLSTEDARTLGLACHVATRAAMGEAKPMIGAGLPSGGLVRATRWEDRFSLYQSVFEGLTLSLLLKSSITRVHTDAFNMAILRREEPPTCEELIKDLPDQAT